MGSASGLRPEISYFKNILANALDCVCDLGLLVTLLVERDACDADSVAAGILVEMFDLSLWVNFGNLSVDLGAIAAQGKCGLLGCAGIIGVEAFGGGADLDFHLSFSHSGTVPVC